MLTELLEILNHPFNRLQKKQTLLRVVFWKLNQLCTHFAVVRTLPLGIRCLCYPDSSYGGLVIYKGYPEYDAMRLWEKNIAITDVVIDVGANIGLMSLIAAAKTKRPVYAFEADSRVFPRLQENINLNNLAAQIIPIHKAVSNKQGKVTFAMENHTEVSHIQYSNARQKKRSLRRSRVTTQTVSAISLDAFARNQRLTKNLVIKIDVEGAELMVLKGMKRLLSKQQVKFLLFEVNQNCSKFGYEPQDLIQLLDHHQYRVYSLEPFARVRTTDPFSFGDETAFNMIAVPKNAIIKKSRK